MENPLRFYKAGGIKSNSYDKRPAMRALSFTVLSLVHYSIHAAAVLFRHGHGNAGGGAALKYIQAFAEALEMNDLALPEEAEGVQQVGVVGEHHKVLIG